MLIDLEKALYEKGYKYIAGVDEVGRGALAGPFVVGTVILDLEKILSYIRNNDVLCQKLELIKDSKQLTQKNRENTANVIYEICISSSIEVLSHKEVDEFGISKCTQIGFYNAIKKLSVDPDHILTDAFPINKLSPRIQTNVKNGDELSISIAAASVIAKVFRDSLMKKLHRKYEVYGFDRHKGYGTKFHIEKLKEFGPCEIHRMSFHPLKKTRSDG